MSDSVDWGWYFWALFSAIFHGVAILYRFSRPLSNFTHIRDDATIYLSLDFALILSCTSRFYFDTPLSSYSPSSWQRPLHTSHLLWLFWLSLAFVTMQSVGIYLIVCYFFHATCRHAWLSCHTKIPSSTDALGIRSAASPFYLPYSHYVAVEHVHTLPLASHRFQCLSK